MFDQVTIVGLGLIGGSLGMAIRRHRLAKEIIGVSRREATLRLAKRRGAITAGTTDVRRAVRDADLVILAVPVDDIVPLARRAARLMRPGSILTDVGSTKRMIVSRAEPAMPRGVAFVGGHPIAGSEQSGIEAAAPDLFRGAACVLTPTRQTHPAALRRVASFWRALGARVVLMSPAQHDRVLAASSHVPHLLAAALAHTAETHPLPRAPRSFLEMTRIARSQPELWTQIFLSNPAEILAAAGRVDRTWTALCSAIRQGDRARLRQLLASAQSKRDALD